MENQEKNVNQQPQGWRNVVISPEMPLNALVQFFNVLNQRLCTIEDNFQVELENNEKLTITELYQLQEELERQKTQQEQEQKGE